MKDNKMTDKIYIDNSHFMELVDALATQITEMESIASGGVWSQDYYNEKYDEYEMVFNTIANIYSDERQ